MKLKDIGIMNEAVVNVPKHWIDMIIKEYMEPTKYAFMMEFSENDNEAEEIANEINYQSAQYKVHHSIFKNKNKMTVLKNELTLVDQYDETFIDNATVMLVAKYSPDVKSAGSFGTHPTYGNMIVLNIAYPLADSDKSLDDAQAIKEVERTMREVIEHELVHLIQHENGNPNQLKKNAGYSNKSTGNTKEYHKSPVEFNAMITSYIRDMERRIDDLDVQDKRSMGYDNLLNGIQYSIGLTNKTYKHTGSKSIDSKMGNIFDATFMPNDFMMDLKHDKPKEWKRAVKAIVKHFENYLQA